MSERQVRAGVQRHWLSKVSTGNCTVRSKQESVVAVDGQVICFAKGSAIRWNCPLCGNDHENQLDEFDDRAKLCFCERGHGTAILVEW